MKNKKRIVLILAFIFLGIFIVGAAYSYAKYFTKSDNSLGSSIKQWDILVNNESIRNKTTLTNSITAVFPNANGHTKTNKIAPGVEGNFQIVIDYTNVDVSFSYDLSIAKNETLPDIKLKNIEVNGVPASSSQISVDANGITHIIGTVTINSSTTVRSQTIKVYVEWDDDDATETMDDEDDTEVGVSVTSVDFDVQMSFVQIEE